MSKIKQGIYWALTLVTFLIYGNVKAQVINGNGNIITQTLGLTSVSSFVFYPDMSNIEIIEGSTQSISIQGDDNILDSLNVYTSGDSLLVKFPVGNLYNNYTLHMTITVPNIKSVDLFETGELIINDFSNATDLSIRNHGEGNIYVNEFLSATDLEIINNDSGEITMNDNFPVLSNYTIFVHGSGNFYGCELNVDSCLVQNFGSGHAYVKANSFLNATIFGSGNIEYLGSPVLYQNNFGTGSILVNTSSTCSGSGSGSSTSCVDGDLNIITQSISINNIENLDLLVDLTTVEISQGTSQSISISGDSNIVNLLNFNVVGDSLEITSDSCFQNHTLNIEIITPNFEALNFKKSGLVTINDFTTTEKLILNNHSNGHIVVGGYQDAYYLSVNNYDSGDITMTSDFTFVSSYQVNNYGSGNYYGCQIDVASCYAHNAGSGLISVGVSGYLNAIIDGSGHIEYYSDPANIDETISGLGQVLEGTDISCLDTSSGSGCIEGNGVIVTQNISITSVENIVIDADFTTFTINQGSVQSISAQGDNNILDSLEFSVVGDTVIIHFLTDTCFENYNLDLSITLPNLSSISYLRTGSSEINDFSNIDSLTIINWGDADIQLGEFSDLNYLNIINHGGGQINFNDEQPQLQTLHVTNTGSGGYYGCEQALDSCYAVNLGSGTISIQVSEYLQATIESNGDIEYYGSPIVQSTINGSGQVMAGANADCLSFVISVNTPLDNEIIVYPNPVKHTLFVSNIKQNSNIVIVNMLGENLLRMKSTSSQEALDISQLKLGTYILSINGRPQLFVKQ